MTKQEEIEEWAFAFLRPICVSDEDCLTYIHDFFSGLSERGVVIKVDRELPESQHTTKGDHEHGYYEYGQEDMLQAGYMATAPLIEED